jgi:tetratricopeptide (TPR) repeat protein
MRRSIAGLVAIVVVMLAAAAARADDEKTERARIHLKAGIAYYDEARYDDAVREMEAAYQLKSLPDLQYDLAQCYERLGRWDDAATSYEIYLKSGPEDRKLVATRIANLRERARAAAAGAPAPAAPPVEKVVFKTLVVYRDKPPLPGRGVRVAAYGVGALALGALASGIAFAVLASKEADQVTNGGSTITAPPFDGSARDAQSRGQTDVIASGVSFGIAGLCAGGAIGLYLYGHKLDREFSKTLARGD